MLRSWAATLAATARGSAGLSSVAGLGVGVGVMGGCSLDALVEGVGYKQAGHALPVLGVASEEVLHLLNGVAVAVPIQLPPDKPQWAVDVVLLPPPFDSEWGHA